MHISEERKLFSTIFFCLGLLLLSVSVIAAFQMPLVVRSTEMRILFGVIICFLSVCGYYLTFVMSPQMCKKK